MRTATKNGKTKTNTDIAVAALKRGNGRHNPNRLADAEAKVKPRALQVSPPKFAVAVFKIRGTTAYMQNRFSAKAKEEIIRIQTEGRRSQKGTNRQPKDFQKCYEQAQHVSTDGWLGIPCAAFRAGMISACRCVGYKMTHAKLALNKVLPDGFDREEGDPLIRITKGEPKFDQRAVRNDNDSVDIRARPIWEAGWEATVRVRFDTEMLSADDVANLFARVGIQIGVGEGRPDSKNSAGMDLGQFEIVND